LDRGKGWCGEPLKDLLDGGNEDSGQVLAAMRATHQRREGRMDTTMRMMCVSRHRAHLMGLVSLTDKPTYVVRDRRADKDGREDPRRKASNHQIASIANFFARQSSHHLGHSFVAEANYATAIGRDATQGPDAQTVDPELDVVTMAVKVPETLAHLHYWSVQMTRAASKDEVLDAFPASSRIGLIRISDGLVALNSVKELMADRGRPHDNLYEVALWADMLRVQGDELFYAYMVDNQAIVIPETIDAIRALTGTVQDPATSIARTNAALGIEAALV